MLPPSEMLAIKKRRMDPVFLLAFVLWSGCAPPGPRALLKGERLIGEGKNEEAVESLQTATRLLPRNAQAYNHLGLALHGSKQYVPALKAYVKALELDHKLAPARYNLGCLYLEQNDAPRAIEQLTTYTLLQPSSLEGWLKLGDAQLRDRRFDAAEKSFKAALALSPRQPEALNGLGVVQVQRRRTQDALGFFNFAASQDANYGPAVLNAAILYHQQTSTRSIALEKYRRYLTLQPRPPQWEAVSTLAGKLESELNPPPPPPAHLVQINASPPPVPKTNVLTAVAAPPSRVVSNHPPPAITAAPVRTNLAPPPIPPKVASQTNPVLPTPPPGLAAVPPKSPPQTNLANTNPNPVLVANVKPPAPEPPKPPPAVVASKPVDVEVTRVPEELVINPPQEIVVIKPPVTPAPPPVEKPVVSVATNPPSVVFDPRKPDTKPEKRSLISRLNPFGGKPKPPTKENPAVPIPEFAKTNPVIVAVISTNPASSIPTMPPPPAFPRYNYISPPKPAPGVRRDAERFFADGIKAQQAGRSAQALALYQKAVQLDPAYFEAYYNRGLAGYGMANWRESLSDYEHALAIKPDSIDARYNFALALQQANYPLDSADELREILNENPSETRAHFLLANLCARQLNEPKLAREHYLKVLERDPHHPKAAEIRYWLAANP